MNAFALAAVLAAQTLPRTTAERTNYAATSTTAEVGAFLDSLQLAGAPIAVSEIGTTALGKPIYLVIASDPPVTSRSEADPAGRLVVYVQANIHGGEVEGKEAVLAILRELVAERRELPRTLVILVVPNYNADGNDAFGPQAQNRSSQNGPEVIGRRTEGLNLDLNRDYFKAEAPETRAALARVFTAWDPALFVDLHTTDGTRHGYQLTYAPPLDPNSPAGPATFVRDQMLPALRRTLQEKYRRPIFDYGNVEREGEPKTWDTYDPTGWFGTNYVGLRGRMAILSEAYSHADFRTWVEVTHAFVVEILNYAAARADEIRRLTREADRQTALEGAGQAARPELAVAYQLAGRGTEPVLLEVGGEIRTLNMAVNDRFVPSKTRPLPAGYFIPAGETGVAALLRLHGVQVRRLAASWSDTVEVLTGTQLTWAPRPFQGHNLLEVTGTYARAVRTVPAGTHFVSTAQPLGRLVFALLEPEGPGLARWNAFDRLLAGNEFPVWRAIRPPRPPSRFLP